VLEKINQAREIQENAVEILREEGEITVYFCPSDDCEAKLLHKLNQSRAIIHCAFYSLNVESIVSLLEQKSSAGIDVKLIVDADNREATQHVSFVKYDTRSAYMHNKFCVLDGKEISTGSMNPTVGDTTENNNNLLFISSPTLARNYEAEFQSFWRGDFGKDDAVEFSKIIFNNFTIENYFCPEDDCEEHIAAILENATTSIKFMQFSFTSDVLGNILLEKSRYVEVAGIFEKMQESQYSEYEMLKNAGANVSVDENGWLLHHKIFIVDNAIVITGSMNPSKNGNENNDENILIIHDKEIARVYLEEYEKIRKIN
jgi:phosphatidylserine/phosphatidylglycerophosphate/cardiolipin synthase-like enzyme